MCSINHDLKAVFIHIHKTGGSYIASVLKRYYGFETYYLKRPDHDTFCLNRRKNPHQKNYENRVHGVYMYYKTSPHLNAKMGMTPQKWATYYKFTFIRNPYDRMISGWNHMNKDRGNRNVPKIPFDQYVTMKGIVSDMEYIHTFMNQAQHIMNERRELVVNFIGHFERLEEDFDKVLTHLGIYYRIHNPYQRVNSHAHLHYSAYFQHPLTLDVVNGLIADDLRYFGGDYPMIGTLEEMREVEKKRAEGIKESAKGGATSESLVYYSTIENGSNDMDNGSVLICSPQEVASSQDIKEVKDGSKNGPIMTTPCNSLLTFGQPSELSTPCYSVLDLKIEPTELSPLQGMILMDQALEEIIRGL